MATIDCSNTRETLWRKRLQLERLAGERLHDAHARDVLLGVRGQLGDPLLDLLDGWAGAAAVTLGDEHHERNRDHRDQTERGVDVDHRGTGQHEGERGLEDEHEAIAEEEAHRLQIDGRARHQLAGLLVVEEAELQLLEVAIEELAQVEFDRERDPSGDQAAEVREHPANEHHPDDHDREHEQLVPVVIARQDLVMLGVLRSALQRVDRLAGEKRDRDRHHHRGAGQQPGGDQRALVGTKEAEKSVERDHSCMVNDYYRRQWTACGGSALAPLLSCVHVEPVDPAARKRRQGRALRHMQLPAGGAKHPWVELLPLHPLAAGSSLSTLPPPAGVELSRVRAARALNSSGPTELISVAL